MNHSLFSENIKLSDLILANYRLMYVLPRFDIDLGFGEATVKQTCEKNGVSIPLFLTICNVYTFDEYLPSEDTLKEIPIEKLIVYLLNSHEDYRQNRMPMLMGQIQHMVINNCSPKHADVLNKFCAKYQEEVLAHFRDEETVVFPYIEQLRTSSNRSRYTISDYESNHGNIEVALTDLKNIMIKYMPGECTVQKCRNVLIGIFLFEDDLNKHSLLEDKVLIPLVERIEREKR